MKKNANFLMSPTVDYCFKELLAYPEDQKRICGSSSK